MTDIKIGDYVTVINADKIYSTYEVLAKSNGLKSWKEVNSCTNGFSGFVTAISSHGTDRGRTLIAVCGYGHEVIIDIKGVKKVQKTSGMKPIKKGMTEAVTRDGRKVTQLTWFEVDSYYDYSCAGVLGGEVLIWTSSGSYLAGCEEDHRDIFAPVEYEWQWLVKNQLSGKFHTSDFFKTEESLKNSSNKFNPFEWTIVSRIEESKREVK